MSSCYEKLEESKLSKINTGAYKVEGEIVKSQGRGQNIELIANSIEILGEVMLRNFQFNQKTFI